MKTFTDADLTRWKKEINPAPLITSRGVSLQRNNAEWIGLCPYHAEDTPSFTWWKSEDGTWLSHCFGCGKTGNVFQFVMDHDGISFPAAVTKVLKEAGVSGWVSGQEQIVEGMTAHKHECVTFSMKSYAPAIKALEGDTAAGAWLVARGIGMDVARKFYLGFVQEPRNPDLTLVSPSHPWIHKGWIAFPTMSADRQTVTAIKYRSLVGKKKTAGTEISGILRALSTSTSMYNLQTADLSEDVWVVEGEPDTLVMAQAGCETVGYPAVRRI